MSSPCAPPAWRRWRRRPCSSCSRSSQLAPADGVCVSWCARSQPVVFLGIFPNVVYLRSTAPAVRNLVVGYMRNARMLILKLVLFTRSTYPNRCTTNAFGADYWVADVVVANDYHPFGMVQEGRAVGTGTHRFGFNGKEFDNEWKDGKNIYDYGARFYDPRVGRWLSRDPLEGRFSSSSPYNYCLGNPVYYQDLQRGGSLHSYRDYRVPVTTLHH